MKRCPFCSEEIQDEAIKCRYCGEFLDGRARSAVPTVPSFPGPAWMWGYEYRSKIEILGWPLVHIAQGIDPATSRRRVAKGIIAVGDIAIGAVALGGLAVGGLAFGGIGLGLLSFGGIALGGLSVGGVALALFLAGGGLAVSLGYAVGGMALAPHAMSAAGADPEVLRLLESLWPGLAKLFAAGGG